MSLPRVASETEQREDEHRRAEEGEAERRVGRVHQRDERDERDAGEPDDRTHVSTARAHRIGTSIVRLYCSNSETRSITSMLHVPPGLSTAALRM